MSYTCISCRVAFTDGEVQRAHYKTDWHRYNLKRKVADMPPVTAENFEERVLAQRTAAEQQQHQLNHGSGQVCATCNKHFSSANAYANHLQSNKHQQAEKRVVAAAQASVQRMNEKNLEKGAELDKDAQNEALQQALKEQQRPTPSKATPAEKDRTRPDKPPRLQWLEQQAKKMEKEDGEEEQEEWEDVDEDDDDDDDDDEMDADDDEDAEEEMEEGSSEKPEPTPGAIPVTECLFCRHHSRSLSRNVAHMTKVHSFFLPDVDYLVDLRGLLSYLGEKVGVGNVCLWCNEKGRSFYSTEAVQGHMVDKSHCKLFTDGDSALEFADFYDFRSSYPDAKDGEDAGMRDGELPNEKNMFEFDDDTLELTLPSGAIVGHRSLMRYYKQKFGNQKAVVLAHNTRAVGRVLKQYKLLGWGGNAGKMQQKDMQYVQRMKSKWLLKTGMNNNMVTMHHFRSQVMF